MKSSFKGDHTKRRQVGGILALFFAAAAPRGFRCGQTESLKSWTTQRPTTQRINLCRRTNPTGRLQRRASRHLRLLRTHTRKQVPHRPHVSEQSSDAPTPFPRRTVEKDTHHVSHKLPVLRGEVPGGGELRYGQRQADRRDGRIRQAARVWWVPHTTLHIGRH